MGLELPAIRLLLAMHKERPLEGPVLTLGRQVIHANPLEVRAQFAAAGLQPAELPASLRARGTIRDDEYLFGLMGLELHAMDVSDYEGAEVLHDLNRPLPDELRGRYRTVFDGGTFEHVFDIRAAFENIAALVEPGGRVIHLSPCNNYVNHGFWQLSPRAFYDFYTVNKFVDLRTTIVVQPRSATSSRGWAAFPYDPMEPAGAIAFFSQAEDRLTCLFSAIKTDVSTTNVLPTQSFEATAANGLTPGIGDHYALELSDEGLTVRCVAQLAARPQAE